MSNTATRKCKACQEIININKDDIKDIIYYNKLYYHKDCFIALCEKKMNSNNKKNKPEEWKAALENINNLETETKKSLHDKIFRVNRKDNLNEYLIETYNLSSIDNKRFWQKVSDLENGIYRSRKSKAISIDMLLDCWKWMQNTLDQINIRNKTKKIGPQNNEQRIPYDFAIVVNNIDKYKEHLSKINIIEAATSVPTEKITKINYNNLNSNTNKNESDDISDLLDEIF